MIQMPIDDPDFMYEYSNSSGQFGKVFPNFSILRQREKLIPLTD